jgi:hypothetical protein
MSSDLTHWYPVTERAWCAFRQRATELAGTVIEPEWLGALV